MGTHQDASQPASKKYAERNPEQRKQRIVQACASLLVLEGTNRLTHRRVAEVAGVPLGSTTQYFSSIHELKRAGYGELAQQIVQSYDQFIEKLKQTQGDLDALAACLTDYLKNEDEVRADAVLYAAAVKDAQLRSLTRQGQQRLKEGLCRLVSEKQAESLMTFLDGLVIQKCAYDEPIDFNLAAQVIRLIATAEYK